MTIEINGISQSLIDAVKKVAYDNDYRDQAIQAIKKNIQQGAITPEVGAEQLKAWVTEKYIGFDKLAAKVGPGVAAAIGRKKYGKKKFDHAAATGHSLRNAKPLHAEETELTELSKKTLGRYVNAAVSDYGYYTRNFADEQAPDKVTKRRRGIKQAIQKLTKEENELQELSKKTLGNYIKKAMSQNTIKAAVGGDPDQKNIRKSFKREVGTFRATNRLTGQHKPGWVPGMKEDATPSTPNKNVANYTVTGHDGKIHYKGSLEGARSYKSNLARNLPNTAKKTDIIDTMGSYHDTKDPREGGLIKKIANAARAAKSSKSPINKVLSLKPGDTFKDKDLNVKIAKIGVKEGLDEAKKPKLEPTGDWRKKRWGGKDDSFTPAMKKKADIHPMALHVTGEAPKYKVVAKGHKVRGIKVGEHLTDTELDDATELGHKIKHVKESFNEQRSGTFRHKVGDKVLVPKQLSSEDDHHIGTVVHAPSGSAEIRVQMPTGKGRAYQIGCLHSEVNPYPYPKAKKKLGEMLSEAKKKGGGTFPLKLETEKSDQPKVHYAYPAGGSDSVHGNKAMDVHMRLHKMGLVGGSMGGEHNKSFWLQPTDKKHEGIIDRHVAKHVGAKRITKEELADTGTQSTVAEARDRELGHLLLKKVKNMKPAEIAKGRKLIPALPIKKPSIRVEDVEADQNILVHLRKTIDTQGKHETLFANGETGAIPAEVAQVIFEHLMKLKPDARGEVQMYMQESFDNVLEVYALLEAKKSAKK